MCSPQEVGSLRELLVSCNAVTLTEQEPASCHANELQYCSGYEKEEEGFLGPKRLGHAMHYRIKHMVIHILGTPSMHTCNKTYNGPEGKKAVRRRVQAMLK
jgi:hypothetical protein